MTSSNPGNSQAGSFSAATLTPERSQGQSSDDGRLGGAVYGASNFVAVRPLDQPSQQSGSSSFTEYSITGDSPLRPSLRTGSQQTSSLDSRSGPSVGLTDSSIGSQMLGSMLDMPSSVPDNTSSSDMGSLDLTRMESRSLDLSSGRSTEPALSQARRESPSTSRRPEDQLSSMDTDGSLDLSKSAAALSTLQSVPSQGTGANAR